MSFQRIKNAAFAEVRVQRKMLLIINILMGAGALTYGLNGIVTAMQDGEFFPYGLSIVLFPCGGRLRIFHLQLAFQRYAQQTAVRHYPLAADDGERALLL